MVSMAGLCAERVLLHVMHDYVVWAHPTDVQVSRTQNVSVMQIPRVQIAG